MEEDIWVVCGDRVKVRLGVQVSKVGECIDQSTRSWDIPKIGASFSPLDAIKVLQTPIRRIVGPDKLVWLPDKTGVYSVKSGYHKLKRIEGAADLGPSSSSTVQAHIWKLVWNTTVPQKIKVFVWKACLNILPTRENLFKRKIHPNGLCPICQRYSELVEHLLLFCDWTRPIWFGAQLQIIPEVQSVNSIHGWLGHIRESFKDQPDYLKFVLNSVMCLLWNIWKSRNEAVFQNEKPLPMKVTMQAGLLINELSRLPQNPAPPIQARVQQGKFWRKPLQGAIKFNSDAAFDKDRNKGVAGIIGRDYVLGFTCVFPVSSALQAEALALRESVVLASNMGIQCVVFENDNLELIQTCRNEIQRRELGAIVQDILFMKNGFDRAGFT